MLGGRVFQQEVKVGSSVLVTVCRMVKAAMVVRCVREDTHAQERGLN